MTRNTFEFEANSMLVILGRGLVFRGLVLQGQAIEGDRITVAGSDGPVSGTIVAIERDRELIQRTRSGTELGILLTDLSNPQIENMVMGSDGDDENHTAEHTYLEMLGVSFPAKLVKNVSVSTK